MDTETRITATFTAAGLTYHLTATATTYPRVGSGGAAGHYGAHVVALDSGEMVHNGDLHTIREGDDPLAALFLHATNVRRGVIAKAERERDAYLDQHAAWEADLDAHAERAYAEDRERMAEGRWGAMDDEPAF